MSQNVEVIRSFYGALTQFLEAYRRHPGSLAAAYEAGTLFPQAEAMLSYEEPAIEWTPWRGRGAEGAIRGHHELLKAWDDWLTETEDYGVTVEDLIDSGNERVLAVVVLNFTARTSKIRIDTRAFTIYTLQRGKIVRVDEYGDRAVAMEALGGTGPES
jgi:ketosteroid isomerase-like protein